MFPPNPPLPPLPPFPPIAWLVEMKQLESVSDPAALKIAPPSPTVPAAPAPPAVPTWEPAAPLRAACPVASHGDVVEELHRGERDRSPEFKIPPPLPAARPCSITTFEIATLPLEIWNTRSRLLPSMMVWACRASLDREIGRDVEIAVGAAVPAGGGDRQLECARGQHDRVGVGIGVGRHDGRPQRDVARGVLAGLEVHRHRVEHGVDVERGEDHAAFEPLEPGRSRRTLALSFRFRKLNMLHPFREIERTPRTQPELRELKDPRLRQGPINEDQRSPGTSGEFATIPAFKRVPLARRHRLSQCGFVSNSAINLRKSAQSRHGVEILGGVPGSDVHWRLLPLFSARTAVEFPNGFSIFWEICDLMKEGWFEPFW